MLNPKRDFVLVKEVMYEEEEQTGLLDNLGNTVKKSKYNNNGTTRYGYVVAVGPTNEEVSVNELVHFGPHCGTIVGYENEDFILLQGLEVIMSQDGISYKAPLALVSEIKNVAKA
jgi:co-chaperonin GroES (HSP10)